MRRFLLRLMVVLATIGAILWILLAIREQNYYQLADYTQFSSRADVQVYLDQNKVYPNVKTAKWGNDQWKILHY